MVSAESIPDHGPAYTLQWIGGPCAGFGEPMHDEGWPFPGVGGALKDGVSDYYYDMTSMLIDQSGEWWQKTYMEQGQGME